MTRHASEYGVLDHTPPNFTTDTVFGMKISGLNVSQASEYLASMGDMPGCGARLFVTPNIQHIAMMRTNSELRDAMRSADIVTCDGFPVLKYARMRGCAIPGRITGREVVYELMHRTVLAPSHRLFFLVDGPQTAVAVQRWAVERGLDQRVYAEVAPPAFGDDRAYCAALAEKVARFETTMLFLCVGAPRSELFAARFRNQLPDCRVLCIGQSVKIALGITRPPPVIVEKLNLEWLWRIALEPRRLLGRYVFGLIGFTLAVIEDLTGRRRNT